MLYLSYMEDKALETTPSETNLPVTFRPMPVSHYGEGTRLEVAQSHDALPIAYMLEAVAEAWSTLREPKEIMSYAIGTCRLLKERRDLMGLPNAHYDKEIKRSFVVPLD